MFFFLLQYVAGRVLVITWHIACCNARQTINHSVFITDESQFRFARAQRTKGRRVQLTPSSVWNSTQNCDALPRCSYGLSHAAGAARCLCRHRHHRRLLAKTFSRCPHDRHMNELANSRRAGTSAAKGQWRLWRHHSSFVSLELSTSAWWNPGSWTAPSAHLQWCQCREVRRIALDHACERKLYHASWTQAVSDHASCIYCRDSIDNTHMFTGIDFKGCLNHEILCEYPFKGQTG